MSKTTLQVLADRRHLVDDIVAAGEVLNLRFQPNQTALSLRAAKLLHGLIEAAGVDAGKDMIHTIAISKLNSFHVSKEDFFATCEELFGVSVRMEIRTENGKKATKAGPLIADVERDDDDGGELRFELSRVLREVMRHSNHWAVLSREAVCAFQSRYSLRLYELLSIRVGLDKVREEIFSLDDLRALFGVGEGKLPRWQDLKANVLEKSIAEVAQLTGLTVRYEVIKRGRSVSAVKLIWREKSKREREATARELNSSSIGRAARRAGTVEEIIEQSDDDRAEIAASLRDLMASLAENKRP